MRAYDPDLTYPNSLADQPDRPRAGTAAPARLRYDEALRYLRGEITQLDHIAAAIRGHWENHYGPRTTMQRGPTADVCIAIIIGNRDGFADGTAYGQDAADADRPSGALGVVFGLVVGVLGTLALFATGYLIGGW